MTFLQLLDHRLGVGGIALSFDDLCGHMLAIGHLHSSRHQLLGNGVGVAFLQTYLLLCRLIGLLGLARDDALLSAGLARLLNVLG